MKRHLMLLACLFSGTLLIHAEEQIQSRQAYLKNIHADIYALTKQIDALMQKRALEISTENRARIHDQIKEIQYQRDIFLQHKRDLIKHGFWQIQQL